MQIYNLVINETYIFIWRWISHTQLFSVNQKNTALFYFTWEFWKLLDPRNMAICLDVSSFSYESSDSAAFAEMHPGTDMNNSLAGSEPWVLWLEEITSIQLCSWNTSSTAWEGTAALEQLTLLNQSSCICVDGSNNALVYNVECKSQQ